MDKHSQCRLCGSDSQYLFSAQIHGQHEVRYYKCRTCSLIQTEEPYWLSKAYQEAINIEDTGIVGRNYWHSAVVGLVLAMHFGRHKTYLDYAGGYGMLVRMMRDAGFDFLWEDKYAPNLFARGFEYNGEPIGALTCFECFEHFSRPKEDIEKVLGISKNIIFSTLLYPDPLPKPTDWWYFGLRHGQHIAFYNKATLKWIAHKYNLHLITDNRILHMFSAKRIASWEFIALSKIFGKLLWPIYRRLFLHSKTIEDMKRAEGIEINNSL